MRRGSRRVKHATTDPVPRSHIRLPAGCYLEALGASSSASRSIFPDVRGFGPALGLFPLVLRPFQHDLPGQLPGTPAFLLGGTPFCPDFRAVLLKAPPIQPGAPACLLGAPASLGAPPH